MKNNDLHNKLSALDGGDISTPQHQAVLKRALMNYEAPQQTLAQKLLVATKTIVGVPMTHKKIFAGIGSFSVVALLALVLTASNFGHSPRADAEQLINQGLSFVHTASSDEMNRIQTQLGGDPIKELETAKAAKDVTILTPDEFKTESAKHKGMAMSSLGGDGPQFGSVAFSADGNLPTGAPDGARTFSTGGEAGQKSGGGEGPTTVTSGSFPEGGTSNGPVLHKNGDLPDFQPPQPAKYLRYTDSTGHVVALGLDEHGVPISKTIFMTDDEATKAQGPGPIHIQSQAKN